MYPLREVKGGFSLLTRVNKIWEKLRLRSESRGKVKVSFFFFFSVNGDRKRLKSVVNAALTIRNFLLNVTDAIEIIIRGLENFQPSTSFQIFSFLHACQTCPTCRKNSSQVRFKKIPIFSLPRFAFASSVFGSAVVNNRNVYKLYYYLTELQRERIGNLGKYPESREVFLSRREWIQKEREKGEKVGE